jgi:hypothetical protein
VQPADLRVRRAGTRIGTGASFGFTRLDQREKPVEVVVGYRTKL